ncbi:osmoprotectant transport system permease protein [Lentibacillus persicus]|uniref:Osmoprotectant transport system permease protein n=1 Tax=Lentibacillus persicus TaxID=640948 RepID=A0A1I1W3C3_9BACI|nr:ABC transporter permease [Lentibacillus persicus]SFD88878.1 osmoprotectant transport system permease protein [Lentibacillus persicus]
MELVSDYIEFWQEKNNVIWEYTYQHIAISFIAILFAILLTVPLAIYMTKMKNNFIKNSIFNIANVFQTIPTIALFAIMIPFLGIGFKPAVIALFLYALLPLLRNTYAGVQAIEPDIIESAKGMGYSPMQRIFKIEIPVALPYIMSGIRTTTVYVISWTTLAAVVGAGGLGGLVLSGIGFNDQHMIFTGTILAILMALLLDFFFASVEQKLLKR